MTTSSRTWGAAEAAWLARRDPALRLLPDALASAAHPNWMLHDAQWAPGQRCRLAYRVRHPSGEDSFMALDVASTGWSQHRHRTDPALPGLSALSDPDTAAELLAGIIGDPIRSVRVRPVRYRPGSRCVLRYEVSGGTTTTTVFAKVFEAGIFRDASDAAMFVASKNGQLVADVVGVWPEFRAIVSRAVEGQPLSAALADEARPIADRIDLADRLGGLLAEFHALTGVPAPSRTADDQMAALRELATTVQTADARLGERFTAALDQLATTIPRTATFVLCHGGFRPGQAVVDDQGGLTLLDLDSVCRGDGTRDLATAVAHLTWQCIKQPKSRPALQQVQDAFLAAYQARAGHVDPNVLVWWRAAALLQVAGRRYRQLDLGDWPRVPSLLRAAEDLLSRRTSGQVAWGGPDLLDQSRMSSLFRKALAPVASTPHQVSVATADLIASAAGRRRVVQYTIEGLEGEQPVTLVAKASTEPQRARLLYQHLRVLSNGPFARGRLRVPQPVAFLPEHHLVLYRPAEGVPLSELDDWPLAVEATREAARWLARLHTSGLNLPRTLDLGREARSTHQWADMIGSYRRTLFRPAHRLASRWAMAARAAPSRGCVPIHKDFHAGHVVVGSDVCVIDLDEARNGNPALDVAHFCTYLEHQTDRAETLRDAFLEEYKSATGWEDDESFASFSAYTWLKIAKQLTLRSGPCRGGESGQGISVEEALNRGLACLDR